MKKIKKVFAILLSLAMVMGMSMTGFAAEKEATISIKNAGAGTFQYVQVIKPDQTTETGWAFATAAIEAKYLEAFTETDDQVVLKALIEETADATEIQTALKNVLAAATLLNAAGNPFTVTEAGVYAIKGEETDYAYSPMAAYVAFKDYDKTAGIPTALENAEVDAKKAPTKIVKENNDDDKVVEIGREVTYNISTTVPYIAADIVNPQYIVTDTITGAKYVENEDGKVQVSVQIGTNTASIYLAEVNGNSFTLDLSDILTGNSNANNDLNLTYKAVVTDTIIGNNVTASDPENDINYGTDGDKLITGEIILTKTGEEGVLLAGAEFVVYRDVAGTISYATFGTDNKLTGWVNSEADATRVTTGEDGKVKVQGLDAAGTYKFKEVKAPEGYSINTEDATVTWTEADSQLTETVKGTTSMTDTKLGELPSTGGIGTTIFTIGGCLIMIIAAGLFFASRKKSSK